MNLEQIKYGLFCSFYLFYTGSCKESELFTIQSDIPTNPSLAGSLEEPLTVDYDHEAEGYPSQLYKYTLIKPPSPVEARPVYKKSIENVNIMDIMDNARGEKQVLIRPYNSRKLVYKLRDKETTTTKFGEANADEKKTHSSSKKQAKYTSVKPMGPGHKRMQNIVNTGYTDVIALPPKNNLMTEEVYNSPAYNIIVTRSGEEG